MKIYYDGHCQICIGLANILRKVDRFNKLQLISFRSLASYPEAMEGEIHVYNNGKLYRGFDGLLAIARKLPIFWFVVPGLYLVKGLKLGDFFYKEIARARNRFFKTTCDDHCFRKQN